MKALGIILTLAGAAGVLVTIINYINETEEFSFLGLDVTVSEGNITPIIIFGILLIIGLFFLIGTRKIS